MGGEAFSKLSRSAPPEGRRLPPLRRQRPREEARRLRGSRRPHAARADLRSRRRRHATASSSRVIPGGSSCPVLRADEHRRRAGREVARSTRGTARASSTCPWASTRSAPSARCSAPAARSCSSDRGLPGPGDAQPDALLPPRVVRAVHAVPRGQRWLDRILDAHRRTARARWRSSIGSTTSRTTSWATPSARSAKARRCRRSASCKKFRKEFEEYVRTERQVVHRAARAMSSVRTAALPRELGQHARHLMRLRSSSSSRSPRSLVLVGGVGHRRRAEPDPRRDGPAR